jgi:hypothetical protein
MDCNGRRRASPGAKRAGPLIGVRNVAALFKAADSCFSQSDSNPVLAARHHGTLAGPEQTRGTRTALRSSLSGVCLENVGKGKRSFKAEGTNRTGKRAGSLRPPTLSSHQEEPLGRFLGKVHGRNGLGPGRRVVVRPGGRTRHLRRDHLGEAANVSIVFAHRRVVVAAGHGDSILGSA